MVLGSKELHGKWKKEELSVCEEMQMDGMMDVQV